MFRNLRLYRLHNDWPESEDELSNQLKNVPFKPCGSFTERSSGWEAPSAEIPDSLARRVGGADLIRLRSQTRLLPPAVINEVLEDRLNEFKSRTQRTPSRKEKRDLKDEVISELMPKALLKSDRIWGMYLIAEKLIIVDTASEVQAERFLDQLRAAFGSLQITPLAFQDSLSKLMTSVFQGGGPPAFEASRECRMQDPSHGSAWVNWMDVDLSDPSVQKHVTEGFVVDRLGLGFESIVSFVISQDAVIRKFKFQELDGVDAEIGTDESPLAKLDAEFVLFSGMLQRLMLALKKQLRGYA